MGTFEGHIAHGIGIMLVGLWHVLNNARSYAHSPSQFESRPWFPVHNVHRHLELYIIACFTIFSITTELVVTPQSHRPWDADGSIPIQHMNRMEHATISMFFLVYSVAAWVVDRYQVRTPKGLVHALGALAFGQELLLFHFHSTDRGGLEGQFHWLLQLIVAVCLGTTLLEAALPHSALVALTRSASLFFQGIWLCHMAFALWVPAFVPKGCAMGRKKDVRVARCSGQEITERAMALANLQFGWDLAFVVFTVLGILFYYSSAGAKVSYQALDQSLHTIEFSKEYSQSGTFEGTEQRSSEGRE